MGLPMVVIAMSGGVDSSVAAARLVEQGYPVVGMMLRLWSEEGHEGENRCCTPDAMAQARRVAAILGIPFYALDARERFRATVVQAFLDGYQRGETPNPCVSCNRLIRWGFLLEEALSVGAEFLATGHYARLRSQPDGRVELLRAVDYLKDQSYVLSSLSQAQLKHTLLPLGEYTKVEIREMARRLDLPVAERPDSQDLCFLGGEDYRTFLPRHAPDANHPGAIVNHNGIEIGRHQGLAYYTIGQRKGLGIASAVPMYVLEKDLTRNQLVVGPASLLGKMDLYLTDINWIAGEPPSTEFRGEVKIRYKAADAPAVIRPVRYANAEVVFDRPVRDITPGQLGVIYQGELVVGSGRIGTTVAAD